MSVVKTTTVSIRLNEAELRNALVKWAKAEHGIDVDPTGIELEFRGGYSETDPYDPHRTTYVKPKFVSATLSTRQIG
jgi:hypothetical protein